MLLDKRVGFDPRKEKRKDVMDLLRTRLWSRFSMDRMCRYWKKGHGQIHEDRTRRFIDSKIIDIRYYEDSVKFLGTQLRPTFIFWY